jgi:site-specific DNA recombinase
MKTAAIYARVSSEKQKDENTISSQTASLIEYARNKNYTVPKEWIFEDEGYSGSILVRPGLERIRDLSSEGELECVLVYSPDRLSRKYAYQILLLEEFSRNGVEIVFLKSVEGRTPEERLLIQFQGMIAEYERAQIMERSRRGKRHRAQQGKVNVLSGAPYGYHYEKKTEHSDAYYKIDEAEADIVREIFRLYTDEDYSIGAVARRLNAKGIPTRSNKNGWERSTIWGMLRNPAYKGTACFGKTEKSERKKITRPLRQKGGFSPRCSTSQERPRKDWIEISVPAVISCETFELAQERLRENKRLSSRNTKEPTLLQGLLVCQECGYSMYRTSTRTSKRKIYYYRCIGSDNYRHPGGRVCNNKPIRQDYLDELIWKHIFKLLQDPDLIREEIDHRMHRTMKSDPTKRRRESITKELIRIQKALDKLLDAYQENLISISELRERIPKLRKKESTLKNELHSLDIKTFNQTRLQKLEITIETFLNRLKKSAETTCVEERQKILRILVKDILVNRNSVIINHSIPITEKKKLMTDKQSSYLLCSGRGISVVG